MEESFEVRVKRLFGSSLFETVPKSSFPSTSWSVADGKVERREWNRERGGSPSDREDIPCSSAFYDEDGCFSKKVGRRRDPKEFEGDFDEFEDGDAGEENGNEGGNDDEQEERDIRSSVGLDPTLDNEEEEDLYDLLALCREDAGERLYMKDIKDHSPYLNCHTAVPDFEDSFEEAHRLSRDPRADHLAASVRLKEDKNEEDPSMDLRAKKTVVDAKLKPILKRKEGQIHTNPKKRVRFDPECSGESRTEPSEEPQDIQTVPQAMEKDSSGIPDYIRNPSKYTHYTFDSSEDNGNKHAFEEFCELVKKSNPEPDFPMELPQTVTFTPRKKACDAMTIDQEVSCMESGQILACSAIVEAHDEEACEMEEDDTQTPMAEAGISARKDRRYRSKSNAEDSS